MPSIEVNKLQGISSTRALSESDRAQIDSRALSRATNGAAEANRPGISIEVGAAISAAEPPVNDNRVSEIKQALREGTYPLVPTEIADAMIAARVGFGMAK